jgi:hypothetical protein
MTRRAVLVLLLLLASCQGDDGGQQAAPTTTVTTVGPTTTTEPDPAEEGCKAFSDDSLAAVESMVISKDERIVEAAKAYEDALGQGPSGEFVRATQEVIRACTAAGYEP